MSEQKFYLWTIVAAFIAECCSVAVAYRIHRGVKGLDISVGELMQRSAIVALIISLLGISVWLLSGPLGVEHNSYVLTAIVIAPIGGQIINWIFGLEDWLAGVGIYILRAIPLTALFFLAVAFGTSFVAK